jgi:hypothetical protein
MSVDKEAEVGTRPTAEPKKPVVILALPNDEPEPERAIREALDLVLGEPVRRPRPRPKGWSKPRRKRPRRSR